MRRLLLTFVLIAGSLLGSPTAANGATKVFSKFTSNDAYNRPELNPKFDIEAVEVGLFDSNLDDIHFWIKFKQPLTAAMFNDGQGSWAGILIDLNNDDEEEIVLNTYSRTYDENYSEDSYGGFRNGSKECKTVSWMDLMNNSVYLGFKVSQKCLGLPNKFEVQGYADYVESDKASFDYAPDSFEVVDLGDYYNPKPKATMLVPVASPQSGKTLSNYSTAPENLVSLSSNLRNSVATIECAVGTTGGTGTGWSAKVDIPIGTYKSYLITNYHVVSDCIARGTVNVILNNGPKVQGTLAAWDPDNDLAGIYVTEYVPPLIWQGEFPFQGSWVGVIGSPKGVPGILTTGILSSVSLTDNFVTFTAPINPGNSGGPVFDSIGRVIAVATAKVRDSEGFGIGNGVPLMCKTIVVCPLGLPGWGSKIGNPAPAPSPTPSPSMSSNNKKNQRIIFSAEPLDVSLSRKFIGFKVTSSSGLPVEVSSTDLSICSYENARIELYSVGNCYLALTQEGNETWNPAPFSYVEFSVLPKTSNNPMTAKVTLARKSWASWIETYQYISGANPLKSNQLTFIQVKGICNSSAKSVQPVKNTDAKGKKYPNGSRPYGSPWKCKKSGAFDGVIPVSGGTRFYINDLPKSHVGTQIEFRVGQEIFEVEYVDVE